jgi:sugar lactone lactonase YvrE
MSNCGFPITLSSLERLGEGLRRPESILTTAAGEIFVSDHTCGVRQVGAPARMLIGAPPNFLPNGFAMTRQREFLVANLAGVGGVWRIDQNMLATPFLMEVDGEPLSTCNFVGLDAAGRLWISMSTRHLPRERAFRPGVHDGFIAVVDHDGARIVADGLGFTNECRVHPDGKSLWVNETYRRRLTRIPLLEGSGALRLGAPETVQEFADGDFPDGLAFDAQGAAWVACIVSNRVLRIAGPGLCEVLLSDSDPVQCRGRRTRPRHRRRWRATLASQRVKHRLRRTRPVYGVPGLSARRSHCIVSFAGGWSRARALAFLIARH